MNRPDVLAALKDHLSIMKRGGDHAALSLAIKEIERLQLSKQSEVSGPCQICEGKGFYYISPPGYIVHGETIVNKEECINCSQSPKQPVVIVRVEIKAGDVVEYKVSTSEKL